MKQIIAIVRPYLVERLLEALRLSPLEALEVTEVKGFGRQKSYLDRYSATEYNQAFLPKIEVSLFVDDLRTDEVLKTIVDTCRTGRMGDGKVMVLDVPRMIPIADPDA
jgi:nitrogen regulatory protein P-II 1